ncbi:nuclear transport factor 2 family protein [Rhodococcus sp. T2V]|uniref:nuclear transport factor 2 family protein n=1 Tax=Rhodococcus sp. T2V TaxID=3034164 RepID=UPI0023E0B4FF|nr:nuclear transport factor 2 family protein [Rhodococcus sp. T2V]MDF3309653.1 nuclear transport factor 2 family protein [Rhodococcus sp. T2V]
MNTESDRAAIEAVLIRYVNANDADDWAGMTACFTESARWGDLPPQGRAGLLERFSTMRTRAAEMMPIDDVRSAQHAVSNVEITVDGDTATSYCLATAYLLGPRGDREVLLVRGITYRDYLVRTDEGWLIDHRQHQLNWMFEAAPL